MYYFSIRWNGRSLKEVGLWFPNFQQAEREARGVAEEVRTRFGVGQVNIIIRDQHERIQKEIFAVSD